MAGLKRLATGVWLAFAAALQLPSCQFPNYNVTPDEGSGGEGGSAGAAGPTGGSEAAGAGGVEEGSPCDKGLSCEPVAPGAWLGPVAYWQGAHGSKLPECPEGYAKPVDLHARPVGDPVTCSCTCTPSVQKCNSPSDVKIFSDLGCANECAKASSLACSAVNACSGASVSIYAPVSEPSGSCIVDVQQGDPPPVDWEQDARFCELDVDVESCPGEAACFPTPLRPFASQLCVYQLLVAGQRPPTCPEEYPTGPELLYEVWDDQRACGECECAGPDGGRCNGEVTYGSSSDCSQSSKYVIGADCKEIPKPSHWQVHYSMVPGRCSVATEPEPVGAVVPSGNYHALCCR